MKEPQVSLLHIEELSRRVGVSEHLMRVWEMRFGLIGPAHIEDGVRFYASEDEIRILSMRAYLAQGWTPARAANASKITSGDSKSEHPQGNSAKLDLGDAYSLLRECLDNYDEPAAQSILDGIFADFALETVFRDVLLPYLNEMGIRWAAETLSVGQEHFASNIFRGRLSELARDWAEGNGSTAILACPPGEIHEFALMMAGIMLHRSGWTIRYLGSNTPIGVIIDLAKQTRPELILLSSITTKRFATIVAEMRQLSAIAPVAIAGRGATQEIADECGATLLVGDSVSSPLEIAKIIK